MNWPYSNVSVLRANPQVNQEAYLLATAGAKLLVSRLDTKQQVAEWAAQKDMQEDSRAAKKQKLEDNAIKSSNIILLTTDPRSDHLIVVTEDKSIHVLRLNEDGQVVAESRRVMPKRPCAVQILPDDQSLLCADKFGDVYTLPLIVDVNETVDKNETQTEQQQQQEIFKPSATELTVHTARNRRALENQQRQKNFIKRKDPLAFQNHLLLGHVSMLTDLAFVKQKAGYGHIITADRDEHIRISRAHPQAHITEGYCLGHTEFISKLCPLPGSTLIASGGGDDWIGLWDWSNCELGARIELKEALVAAGVDLYDKLGRITVSKMRCITKAKHDSGNTTRLLFVLCERVKAIAMVTLQNATVDSIYIEKTVDVPLDVAFLKGGIVVSFDARHSSQSRLLEYTFAVQDDKAVLKLSHDVRYAVAQLNDERSTLSTEVSPDDLLYYIANFRKRRDWIERRPGDDELEMVNDEEAREGDTHPGDEHDD